MNKQIITIYVTPKAIDLKDNKISIVEGEFYFQGKKYEIKNSEITNNNENKESIKF